MSDRTDEQAAERRALAVGKWGNLLMGAAGVLAAWLSHSQALLVDGLFSLIGFASAALGARVGAAVSRAPDRLRPFGYAADEAIFAAFRALSLLGLVAFALGAAALNIASYAAGEAMPALRYDVIAVYFAGICAVCLVLALVHRRAWIRTGRRSDVLRMEGKAAAFDGVMTAAAGAGLLAIPLLEGGALGWIVPIGDSVIVAALCVLVVGRYWKDFRTALGELAGVTAPPDRIAAARRAARPALVEAGGRVVDIAVAKMGRSYFVAVYLDPQRPVEAEEIDRLTRRLEADLAPALGPTLALVVPSRHGRAWGAEPPADA